MTAAVAEMMWQNRAACRGPQSRTFFPPPQGERRHERADREARAKAICGQCSVMSNCLEYAVSIRERHGVWGGLSEAERRQLISASDN